MEDGTKKAGGVIVAALVAIGGFAVKTMDSCGSVGASAARYGDDFARVGAGSGDDLARLGSGAGDDLGRLGNYGDDLAGADDLSRAGTSPSSYDLRNGRTGASFGGGAFDEAAHADDALGLADDAFGEEVALSDDAIETIADVVVDVAPDAVEFATSGDDDEPDAWPVRGAPSEVLAVNVVALSPSNVAAADHTVPSFAALEQSFGNGELALVVVRGDRGRVRGAGGESRSVEAVLLRAAQRGQRTVLLVCHSASCMEDAARVASIAAEYGPSGIAERLMATRERVARNAGISLHRLHTSGGGVQLATSQATSGP